MKKFTKLFLSCAIVSALAASTAVMASAADLVTKTNGLAGTYAESGDNAGKLTLDLSKLDGGIDTNQQATLLVVKGTAYTDDASVVGIDQAAAGRFDMTGLKGTPTTDTADEDGYTVMVGYYTAGESSKFQIASATLFAPNAETMTLVVGDISGDGTDVNILDQGMMLRYVAERTDNIGNAGKEYTDATDATKKVVVGDISGDGTDVNILDQGMMLRYVAERTDNIGNAGNTVQVIKPAE